MSRTSNWLLIAQYMPRNQWMSPQEISEAVPMVNGGMKPPHGPLRSCLRHGILERRKAEDDGRRVEYRKVDGPIESRSEVG